MILSAPKLIDGDAVRSVSGVDVCPPAVIRQTSNFGITVCDAFNTVCPAFLGGSTKRLHRNLLYLTLASLTKSRAASCFSGPLNRPLLMSPLPERTENGVLPLKFLRPIQPTTPFNIRRKTESGIMLHGILVDGMIERIEGDPEFANAEVVRLREEGHAAEYLFGARTDDDFRQKERTEKQRLSNRQDDAERERNPL